MSSCKTLTILGATGSVGQQTLDVVRQHLSRFQIIALTANNNAELLAKQAIEFKAKLAVVADCNAYPALKTALSGTGIRTACGYNGLLEAAAEPSDMVMAAIVGLAGLSPTLVAARRGATIALANKEALVCAGNLLMEAIASSGGTLLPVDSEHNAIFQVWEERNRAQIDKLILTASGGPFRQTPVHEMGHITKERALKHPIWTMGAKISIDSATLMNKALEVIEASHLFAMPSDKIDVLVHPQSIVHSMVAYQDGSVLAQLGSPDMRIPIVYCLGWPARLPIQGTQLDLSKLSQLTFEALDAEKFPAVSMAYAALKAGQAAQIAMNAANETMVELFLDGKCSFLEITKAVGAILQNQANIPICTLEDIFAVHDDAVRKTMEWVEQGT